MSGHRMSLGNHATRSSKCPICIVKVVASVFFWIAALLLGVGLVTLVIGIGPLWLKGTAFGGAVLFGLLGWGSARSATGPANAR